MVRTFTAIFLIVLLSVSYAAQGTGVGVQSYWTPEPNFRALFVSVRSAPFEEVKQFSLAMGMGEVVRSGITRPSLNAKAAWRLWDLEGLTLQTAAGVLASYYFRGSLMPIVERVDLFWTIEFEYQLQDKGQLSIGVGIPIGWDRMAFAIGIGFHLNS